MWHASSRSGVATLRTAIHLLLTYLGLLAYPPSPPTAPRFSRLRRSTCDPQCSSGIDAHGYRPSGSAVSRRCACIAPYCWSGDWEGPVVDGRQFKGRHQRTIGASRAEGTSTRQIGDTNQLTQVRRRSSMSGLVHEHGHLESCPVVSAEPMEAVECVGDVV